MSQPERPPAGRPVPGNVTDAGVATRDGARARPGGATGLPVIAIAAGCAAGLGGLLSLPTAIALHGSAFLTAYAICLVAIGLPVVGWEWRLGRRGGALGFASAPGMLQSLTRARWVRYAGALGLALPLLLAVVVVDVQARALGLVVQALGGAAPPAGSAAALRHYVGSDGGFLGQAGWQGSPTALAVLGATLVLDILIASRGLRRGLGLAARVGLPLVFVAAIVLAVQVLSAAGADGSPAWQALQRAASPTVRGLLSPGAAVLWAAAAGQVLVTLAVGSGALPTLAAQCGAGGDSPRRGLAATALAAGLPLLVGVAIVLPALLAAPAGDSLHRVAPDATALAFDVVPAALAGAAAGPDPTSGQAAGASIPLCLAWFGLLFVAGLLSVVALCEPLVAFLAGTVGLGRRLAVLLTGALLFVTGLPLLLLPGASVELAFWTLTLGLPLLAAIELLLIVTSSGPRRLRSARPRGAAAGMASAILTLAAWITPVALLALLALVSVAASGPVLHLRSMPTGAPYDGSLARNALFIRFEALAVVAFLALLVAVASHRGHFRRLDVEDAPP